MHLVLDDEGTYLQSEKNSMPLKAKIKIVYNSQEEFFDVADAFCRKNKKANAREERAVL